MKFGRHLHKYQILLWAGSYLDYDGLKILIKHARTESTERGEPLDCAAVLGKIGREIDNVQAFYHTVYMTHWDEVSKFYMSLDFLEQESWENVDWYELRHFLGVFVQCRTALQKLQWFGTVNAYGFRRLLQKLGHLRSDGTLNDVKSKLFAAQFSSQTDALHDLHRVQRSIASIAGAISGAPSVSNRSLVLDKFISQWYTSLKHSDVAYEAIRKDDASSLDQYFRENVDIVTTEKWRNQLLILVLMQLSTICGSAGCIERLLLLMKPIHEDDFTTKEYLPLVITRILVKMGHQELIASFLNQEPTYLQDPGNGTQVDKDSVSLLSRVLAELGTDARVVLLTQDPSFKRIPLQYAAQYGLSEACQLVLSHMQGAENDDGVSSSESVAWLDCLGSSPLRLAISCGYDEVSKLLLAFYSGGQASKNKTRNVLSGALLADAIKANPGVLEHLLAARADVDHQGPHGETALYIGARSGDEESVKGLLSHKASANIAESVRGWTPLFIASVEGHVRIVELLMRAGAIQEDRDLLGWTALDHAAFRGHITLAKKLREFQAESYATPGNMPQRRAAASRPTAPLRMPLRNGLIIFSLGSLDAYRKLIGVKIDPDLATDKRNVEFKPGFSIEICILGEQGSSHTVDIPILEETVNKPWVFNTQDPDSAKLMFKVYRKAMTARDTAESVHIGSGIALLSSLKQGLGSTRESLIRDYKIPILAKDSLEDIGTVTFGFLLVKPYLQSKLPKPATSIFKENSSVTKVVGHRGLGQNVAEHKHLSIGENTIQSYLTAIDMGADGVELSDVQLTKDHVPVVYHDFLVSETGTDGWMHSITLEQFRNISESQSVSVKRHSEELTARRWRSRSLDTRKDYRIADLTERMRHTFEFQHKGFKGNTRGNYIHDPFITVDDLLSKTPDSMMLDIEIKYPMLFEAADDWKSDVFAIELNLFVDTILSSIFSHPSCRSRPIIFSSFSPEVCILVSLKQASFPIFFLNDSGNGPTGDVRASSLQEAIHFAERWGLEGVVMASEPFVYAPRLVELAKGKGLMTASYGALNNEPECAKIQAAAGLDIIVVDAVRQISETLKGTR